MSFKIYLLSFSAKKLMTFSGDLVFEIGDYNFWNRIVSFITVIIVVIVTNIDDIFTITHYSIFNSLIFFILGVISEYIILSIIANIIYFNLEQRLNIKTRQPMNGSKTKKSGDSSKPLKKSD